MFIWCDSLTRMPCNVGTPGALWVPVGKCCEQDVLDAVASLPQGGESDLLL